ncbi:MAG: type IV pilin N-terminal domain-containing protein [Methanocorpusculum sp.]|nr:type IV pilin N-terminal domain-containing protein [Methanocorpusculum sp.]MDE2521688.1 type IV pilin N-terminal domain-containing protein [Methanocorpusculum sp.]MDE2524756.1 type IV pilin N-terminal domain-containing protein [Methanocorpusculum sp.]
MRNEQKFHDAVSPVVGVMLMLVVTIIIAALVASFAGGLATTSEATPQLAIKATYSQSGGMTITHAGGDAISLVGTKFMTTPSDLFGGDAAMFAWTIDPTIIESKGTPIVSTNSAGNSTGFYTTSAFVAGDSLTIAQKNCIDDSRVGPLPNPGVNQNAQLKWGGDATKNAYFGAYAFSNADNVGKYFYLDLIDGKTGNMITRTKVTITA